jgi:hypothetical protein
MENNVRAPGGIYTEKINSFGDLNVGDEVAVLNNGYNVSERQGSPVYSTQYHTGQITHTEPSITFKDPPKKKFGKKEMTEGTTFSILKNDSLLTQPTTEQGYVRIYRKPTAAPVVLQSQNATVQPAQNVTPVGGSRTKRKRRRNKKSKRRYKSKRR